MHVIEFNIRTRDRTVLAIEDDELRACGVLVYLANDPPLSKLFAGCVDSLLKIQLGSSSEASWQCIGVVPVLFLLLEYYFSVMEQSDMPFFRSRLPGDAGPAGKIRPCQLGRLSGGRGYTQPGLADLGLGSGAHH